MLGSLEGSAMDEQFDSLHRNAQADKQAEHDALIKQSSEEGENPYQIHQSLGEEMSKAALVVRRNDQIQEGLDKVSELAERAKNCSLSDTGAWTNQNVVFTKALQDMFPLAKAILKGALARDECRGAHYKPEFEAPGIEGKTVAERRKQAKAWCDAFEKKNKKWLQTTIATFDDEGEPTLSYEKVDTSLIPPRPRLYGLVGAEMIEEVWKDREQARLKKEKGEPAMA